MDATVEKFKTCTLPFPPLPFAAFTLNVGQQSVTRDHLDTGNLSFGWCMIIPVGHFNHKIGGHLVLHELGLIIEVPAATTAYITSAAVTHGNTAIQVGEDRRTITAYTSASFFQFAHNEFKPTGTWSDESERMSIGDAVWTEGLPLLPCFLNL